MVVAHVLNPSTWEADAEGRGGRGFRGGRGQRQVDLFELKASLVYKASFRTARDTETPCLKKKQIQQKHGVALYFQGEAYVSST